MFQVSKFSTGGFVIHGITGDFVGRMSAWYNVDGWLLDCEQITKRFGRVGVRPVKRNGPMWKLCVKLGNRHK